MIFDLLTLQGVIVAVAVIVSLFVLCQKEGCKIAGK